MNVPREPCAAPCPDYVSPWRCLRWPDVDRRDQGAVNRTACHYPFTRRPILISSSGLATVAY